MSDPKKPSPILKAFYDNLFELMLWAIVGSTLSLILLAIVICFGPG